MNIARFKPFYLLKNKQSNTKSVKSVKNKSQNLENILRFLFYRFLSSPEIGYLKKKLNPIIIQKHKS